MTSFALLLNGNEGKGGSSSGVSYVLAWVSLALVATAVVIIIIAVMSSEIWFRYKRHEASKEFEQIRKKIEKASAESGKE